MNGKKIAKRIYEEGQACDQDETGEGVEACLNILDAMVSQAMDEGDISTEEYCRECIDAL